METCHLRSQSLKSSSLSLFFVQPLTKGSQLINTFSSHVLFHHHFPLCTRVSSLLIFTRESFYSSNPAHRYYLATDPVTGDLYVSDTNTRRIYRPKSLTGAKDLTKNAEVVAGTGEQCLPFDEARCGDGGKAVEATLMSPKGTSIINLGFSFDYVFYKGKKKSIRFLSL